MIFRPSSSLPFNSEMARWASSAVAISMKPKPRDCPENLSVTTDADSLARVAVTGELVAHTKGPKIRIHHFKNKTRYHRRLGHRQQLTRVKVTGIESGK